MAAINFKRFDGEIPREQGYALPDASAQSAKWCDLGGHLNPLRGGTFVGADGNSQNIKSAFYDRSDVLASGPTYDRWYVWPRDVRMYVSPVIADTHDRAYFVDQRSGTEGLKNYVLVAISCASAVLASDEFHEPVTGNVGLAGVPAPRAAPTLSVVELTTLPDYPGATLEIVTWYTSDGIVYDVSAPAVKTSFTTNTITVPAPGSAPDGASLVVQVTIKHEGKTILTLDSEVGVAVPPRSSALPGGVELVLQYAGTALLNVHLVWGIVETRAYVVVSVNDWAEESAPSPPALISTTYLQEVLIGLSAEAWPVWTADGIYYGRNLKLFNVYRTYSGVPTYFSAFSVDPTFTSVSPPTSYYWTDHTRTPAPDTKALDTINWNVPPTQVTPSLGFIAVPNGWFATFKDNTLYMSEPYHPHAWPYSMAFDTPIVGVCAGAQSLVVTTKNNCFIVTGAHPAAIQQIKLPIPIGGVSQRGMAQLDGAVAFVSNDGIVLVEGSNASLEISQKFFTREKWQELYGDSLEDMYLTYHDGRLLATIKNAAHPAGVGFMVKLDENAGEMTSLAAHNFDSTFRVSRMDYTFYASGDSFYRFDNNSVQPRTYTWHSKEFTFNDAIKFGAGYIRFKPWAEATVYSTITPIMAAGGERTFNFNVYEGQGLHFSGAGATGNSWYEATFSDGTGRTETVQIGWRDGDVFTVTARDFPSATPWEAGTYKVVPSNQYAGVEVRVYLDGELYSSKVMLESGYFRIPAVGTSASLVPRDGIGRRWSFLLTSSAEVYELTFAQTMQELRHV